jgi:predicted secreted protein
VRWAFISLIYFLFWVMSAFIVLPFGLRSHDDTKADLVPGQFSSAPVNFNPRRIALRATLLSLGFFGLYYGNYTYHWLTVDSLRILFPVPKLG